MSRGRFRRRPSAAALAGWALVAALVWAGMAPAPPAGDKVGTPRPARPLLLRLFGPVASLSAGLQWVRADVARARGDRPLALARAADALALDPESAHGWGTLAYWQAIEFGAPSREPDAARRLAWLRAGLATAAEGERRSDDPGSLAFLQGVLLSKVLAVDADLPWPGGAPALQREIAEHWTRAARLGYRPLEALEEALESETHGSSHPGAPEGGDSH